MRVVKAGLTCALAGCAEPLAAALSRASGEMSTLSPLPALLAVALSLFCTFKVPCVPPEAAAKLTTVFERLFTSIFPAQSYKLFHLYTLRQAEHETLVVPGCPLPRFTPQTLVRSHTHVCNRAAYHAQFSYHLHTSAKIKVS